MSVEDALQEIRLALEHLESAWTDHDCHDELNAAHTDELAASWDDGRAELKRALLDDIETWKRQNAVGMETPNWSLEYLEGWLSRK